MRYPATTPQDIQDNVELQQAPNTEYVLNIQGNEVSYQLSTTGISAPIRESRNMRGRFTEWTNPSGDISEAMEQNIRAKQFKGWYVCLFPHKLRYDSALLHVKIWRSKLSRSLHIH